MASGRHCAPLAIPADRSGIFAEETALSAFRADVETCRRSLVIFTSVLTLRGADAGEAALVAAIGRGVAVRVVSRPPDEQVGATHAIQKLRGTGAVVDFRSEITMNLAIVDGSILWHGTRQFFAHDAPDAYLIRLQARHASEQVARFLTTPGADLADFSAGENPTCPRCKKDTIWHRGKTGAYFTCIAGCEGHLYATMRAGERQTRTGTGGVRRVAR